MFETSQDILNLAKTVAVVGLSFLLGWLLFYLAMIVRSIFKVIKEMRERINKVDELIKKIKDKIEHSSSYLFLISEGVKKLVEVAKDYSEKKKERWK